MDESEDSQLEAAIRASLADAEKRGAEEGISRTPKVVSMAAITPRERRRTVNGRRKKAKRRRVTKMASKLKANWRRFRAPATRKKKPTMPKDEWRKAGRKSRNRNP